MRNLIKLMLILCIAVAAIGFYRGWFSLSTHRRDADSDKVNLNVDVSVDKGKVKSDVKKAEAKVEEEVHQLEGKSKNN